MWIQLLKLSGYGLAVKQIADQVASVQQERRMALRRHRNKHLAIGVTLGAAVGTTAALMLTPKTGEQNRQALAKQTNETLNQLRQRAARAKEHAQETIEERREQRRRSTGVGC